MAQTGMHFFETINESEIFDIASRWRQDHAEMGLLALVAEADRETAPKALQNICARLNLPLRGAIFPALFSRSGFQGKGVVLLRHDIMPFSAIYEPLKPSLPSATQIIDRMVRNIADQLTQPRDNALFLIFDAMVVNIASILDELYLKLADRVHYLGVNAGSESFRPMPCLFDNSRIVQDGVLVMLLPNHCGAVVEHCYRAPERMISATSTEGSRIITIDWQPAFEVYQEVIAAEYGVKVDRANFYQYSAHFPFGIVRAGGEIIVRIPVALENDGSLFCVGEVPPNAVLTLLKAPEVDSVQTVETLVRGLHTLKEDLSGTDLLAFYCAGRRIHLGDRAQNELIELDKRTGGRQFAGALSLGEIGHSQQWGYPLFHNGALLCCPWG